jgi:hypothetical protein
MACDDKFLPILEKYGFQKNKAMRSYIVHPDGKVADWLVMFKQAGAPEWSALAFAGIMANNDLNGTDINVGAGERTYGVKPNQILPHAWPIIEPQHTQAVRRLKYWMTTVRHTTLEKWTACMAEIDAARLT